METIQKQIDQIIQDVFQINFNEIQKKIIQISEYIENNKVFFNTEKQEIWAQILNYLTIGLKNKDYLVIADILKYELKPLLEKENLT
ncbi:MAG TPA: hypothetical protein GX534_03980 [Thermoanaerobacterales bacterium]|nr:hypothetical protein [Thermoanaerobacterales bacterium]